MKKLLKKKSRTTEKLAQVTEYRCVVCGEWFEAKSPATTCSPYHRLVKHRTKKQQEKEAS